MGGAGFVGDAVFGAGGGCVGLAIQNYCTVHAMFSLLTALGAWRTRERTYPMNMKGKEDKPANANIWIVISNIPFSTFFVLLWILIGPLWI